jgi:hypothetical protein
MTTEESDKLSGSTISVLSPLASLAQASSLPSSSLLGFYFSVSLPTTFIDCSTSWPLFLQRPPPLGGLLQLRRRQPLLLPEAQLHARLCRLASTLPSTRLQIVGLRLRQLSPHRFSTKMPTSIWSLLSSRRLTKRNR